MLSYLHAFHAGNQADILKHTVLLYILDYLKRKSTPFRVVDTHAGAGLTDLGSERALKTAEHKLGISLLTKLSDRASPLSNLVKAVNTFNASGSLSIYPGSPALIMQALREQDKATFFELHPNEFKALASHVANDKRVRAFREDGLEGACRRMPFAEGRGLVLVDPSYEIKSEYQTVVDQVRHMHNKCPHFVYALWYPVVRRFEADGLLDDFKHSGIRHQHLFEWCWAPDSEEHGMTGCGLLVINPPYTLAQDMTGVLNDLCGQLSTAGGGTVRNTCWVDE